MNKLLLVAVLTCGALIAARDAVAKEAHPASPKSDIENDKIIRALYADFTKAWNQHDVPAMARAWVDDGDHVEPDGHVAKGRGQIEKLLMLQHSTVFKTSQLTLSIEQIWFITSDVALVDGTYEVAGVRNPEGKDVGARSGRLTSTFLKEGGRWHIAADRLMIPASLPWRRP